MSCSNLLATPYINKRLSREKRIGTAVIAHPACMAAVLTHHFLRFRRLVLIVRRLHFLVLLARLLFHFLHLPLGLTHCPIRSAGGARTQHSQKRAHTNY